MGKIIISTTICDGDLGEGWTSNADAAEAYRDFLVRRVEDAIADSSREDRTVTLADEPGLRDELLVASDDNAEVDGVVQYWGTDDEGRPWRVHVALALDA
jgi:hypothetical protein